MILLSEQLKKHNVELTVVSYCFLILIIPALYLIPTGLMSIITSMVDGGYTNPAIWDSWNIGVIVTGLSYVAYLTGGLAIWFLVNAVQMIYFSYRQIFVTPGECS